MEPVFTTGTLKRKWYYGGVARRDELDVYPNSIVIHQRTLSGGTLAVPISNITEVRATATLSGIGREWRLHLRAANKKYVLRRLTRTEAEGAAIAIAEQQHR